MNFFLQIIVDNKKYPAIEIDGILFIRLNKPLCKIYK